MSITSINFIVDYRYALCQLLSAIIFAGVFWIHKLRSNRVQIGHLADSATLLHKLNLFIDRVILFIDEMEKV